MYVTITKGNRTRACHKDDIAAFEGMGYVCADKPVAKKATRKKVTKPESATQEIKLD